MSDYFIFGNIDTRDYEGIYVYFDDIDAIPSRVGEFIEIPGRNGSFYLDKGRYEDVTHTYDIVAMTMEAGRDLINAISSQVGYQRLEDSFNPNELYSAVFTSEVEPNVPTDREQMTFKLMFTRKPQRFLTSGETAIDVDSGDTLTNPTLFESSPLLEVEGYGTINFNRSRIYLSNAMMGNVQILDKVPPTLDYFEISNDPDYSEAKFMTDPIPVLAYANVGDDFTASVDIQVQLTMALGSISSCSITTQPTNMSASFSRNGKNVNLRIGASLNGNVGTSSSSYDSFVFTTVWKIVIGDQTYTTPQVVSVLMEYDSTTSEIAITVRITYHIYQWLENDIQEKVSFVVDSTIQLLGHPTYIDCDIGEVYKIESGEIISLNSYIDLGSKLPILPVGESEITFDNTITDFKVVPRWWKI